VLQPARSRLQKSLGPANRPIAGSVFDLLADNAGERSIDARVADLGRLTAGFTGDPANIANHLPDAEPTPGAALADRANALVTGYAQALPDTAGLTDLERQAVPLLAVAAGFEWLSVLLTGWAAAGHHDPPVTAVAATIPWATEALDTLGIPADAGSLPTGRPSRRPRR
jgi:hypothetical protein